MVMCSTVVKPSKTSKYPGKARAGMFLSFQYPASIPGVQVGTFLKKSVSSVRENPPKGREFRKELTAAMSQLSMDKSFLSRYVNDGFSGGEKKRLEILQLLAANLILLYSTRRIQASILTHFGLLPKELIKLHQILPV